MSAVAEVRGLERTFGAVEALRGLSLQVRSGEIYGLVGPDGAGKTTALRILAGLMAPTKGEARVGGVDPMAGSAAVRDTLGYMPQQYSLYGDLSIEENLKFFADMFGMDRRTYAERTQRLLDITRLTRFKARRADALSGGMYKKLALACALMHRPRLLVLDEPTNGVDPVSRREFWALLGEFVHDGMAVLVSTPYMDEAARCHRVGLIHKGRLLEEGAPAELVERFPHQVFRVAGVGRDGVGEALDGVAGVLALSPSGSRIRVVVQAGCVGDVRARLGRLGGTLEAAAPDFEDLFLTRMRDGEA